MRWAAVLLVLLASLTTLMPSCGGGGQEATPTVARTPTAVSPELKEQLQRMVVQAEDLPAGVILAEEYFVSNEESALASENREERLALLNQWGRVLGYNVTYQPNPEVMSKFGLILVNSAAILYASEEGARAAFVDAVETARATDWTALFSGVHDVRLDEVDSPPLAEEILWLRITAKGDGGDAGEEETFANDIVLFRQGTRRATLMVGWVIDGERHALIEQLAEAQAKRLQDALP